MDTLLEVESLSTFFFTPSGVIRAVDGVTFTVGRGETMGIVGESGCGKSVTALSIMRLVPEPGRITGGSIRLGGLELTGLPEKQMESVRGNMVSMVFQDPMTSLNPVLTVGWQVEEVILRHQGVSRREARSRAIRLLRLVGIPDPERRACQYPHQFSGGMRQRVMIAMAMACSPKLLILDEPTTALDVTVQAQILELVRDLRQRAGMSVVLITHDLGVMAGTADRLIVMYAGKVVESGAVRQLYSEPAHPYTRGLLRSVPRPDRRKKPLQPIPGQPPDMLSPPEGCAFGPRCEHAMRVCLKYPPPPAEVGPGHEAACWLLHPMAPGVRARGRGTAS